MSRLTHPAFIFLALVWGQFLYAISPNWVDHSYYDYGWVLPPLVIYFGWLRWQERSADPGKPLPSLIWAIIVLMILGLVPVRFLENVDPYWRLPLWIHASLVLGVTHGTIGLLFGTRTTIHLFPATFLILLTIPIPSQFEQPFVHGLTTMVVETTSVFLPPAGYPVLKFGFSFMVAGEVVDVAEGCSGIRSFQSCLTGGIILGELQRLSLSKRAILLTAALGLAIVVNTIRVFLLIRITHEEGKAVMENAHDRIGLISAIITFVLIGVMARFLDRASGSRIAASSNPKA